MSSGFPRKGLPRGAAMRPTDPDLQLLFSNLFFHGALTADPQDVREGDLWVRKDLSPIELRSLLDGTVRTLATSGAAGATVDWANVTGKPATFPPSAHTHPWTEITGKPTNLETTSGAQDKADAAQAAAESYADSALASHVAASNPHPGYLTPAEADALYDALGAAADALADALAALAAHSADTTGVHGIADTSLLETLAGAQAKADAAESNANAYADALAGDAANDLALHAADTTNVHGIVDTAALVLTTDARLSNARTPTAHAASHAAAGSDPLALADLSGNLAGARISGQVASAAAADDAAMLGGEDGAYYLARAHHTGTQTAATISDFATAADSRVAVHVAASDPHTQYHNNTRGDARYDALGAASAAVAAHVAASDPHTQYTTLTEVLAALFNGTIATGGLLAQGVSIGVFDDDSTVGLRLYDSVTGSEWRISASGGLSIYMPGGATYSFYDDGTFSLSGDFTANIINAAQYNLGGVALVDSTSKILGGVGLTNISYQRSTKTAAYTISNSDFIIDADATSAAFSVTLPTAVGRNGRMFRVTRINGGANNVTIATTSSQTINGAANKVLTAQWQSALLYSNGSNWVAA